VVLKAQMAAGLAFYDFSDILEICMDLEHHFKFLLGAIMKHHFLTNDML
jgi:hypothetical protein